MAVAPCLRAQQDAKAVLHGRQWVEIQQPDISALDQPDSHLLQVVGESDIRCRPLRFLFTPCLGIGAQGGEIIG